MTKNIIKYGGIALVIVGIVLVMRNLFTSDEDWENKNSKNTNKTVNSSYNVQVSLVDQESGALLTGAKLVIKDSTGEVVTSWTTENEIHLVNELKQGTYKLVEEEAPEGYHLNGDGIEFKIKDSDQTVSMYNIAMTESEKEEYRKQNTTSNEVGVDNTASFRNHFVTISAIIAIGIGIWLILSQQKRNCEER